MWIPRLVFAFGLSPSLIEEEGYRGEVMEKTITLINTSSSSQTYYLDVLGFEPKEEEGIPVFDFQAQPIMASWFAFSENPLVVQAQNTKEIKVTIAIPADIPSATYYLAVTISPAPEEIISQGASVQAKTAVLFFVTVLGEGESQNVALLDFFSEAPLSSLGPEKFIFRLQNQGTIMAAPTGTIIVRDVFGRRAADLEANGTGGRLLPGKNRTYEVPWQMIKIDSFLDRVFEQWRHFRLGPYTADLYLSYGNQEEIKDTIRFWIIPWHAFLSLGILLSMFSAIFVTKNFLRLFVATPLERKEWLWR